MFKLLSIAFKYIFIFIIYAFLLSIIRLIYLDINNIGKTNDSRVYLKLLNVKEELGFKVFENYPLGQEETIGRSSSNTIVIRDPFMSKNHCKIYLEDSRYLLEDLNSANGSFLNGARLEDREGLDNGDIIRIGQMEFVFVEKD